MAQKYAKKLDALPPSNDAYWEGADINKHELPNSVRCKHYFTRLKSNEIECKKCRIGFFIHPSDELREGHLYKKDKIVI